MNSSFTGPSWLIDDLLRVEGILEGTAGASPHPLVSDASTHLLKAGGKRVRPALVMISSRVAGGPTPATELAAAAIELVHLATLYHDDVIDKTAVRRGVPTTHAKWGTEVAVLAGDYLFACGCSLGAEAGGDVPAILARAIGQVCEGQIIETGVLGDPHRKVDDYLHTIGLKTAALFRSSCELGAATAAADTEQRSALTEFGQALGLAFQIVDDLLDLVGDPLITGKEPGTDLADGVFTMPVLLACERDGDLARDLIAGDRSLSRVLPALEATGALTDAYSKATELGAQAARALGRLPRSEWSVTLETMIEGVLAQVEQLPKPA